MKKVLVFSTRDIFNPGGERNLMENKALALKRQGYSMLYISSRLRGAPKNIPDNLEYEVLSNLSYCMALVKIFNIRNMIGSICPQVVQFTGIWSYFFYPLFKKKIKRSRITVSLDYQGALEELIEFDAGWRLLLKKSLFLLVSKAERKLYKEAHIIEVVSENCIYHLQARYGETRAKFIKIPCVIDAPADKEQYFLWRKEWRGKLGIKEGDIALVYAGGVSKWQCIEEVISYMKGFRGCAKYIFTSNTNHEELRRSTSGDIEVLEVSPYLLRQALCAFDFGLLPRDPSSTNFVAFPNKFSEYYNSRLTILIKNKNIGFYSDFSLVCKIIDFYDEKIPDKVSLDKFNPSKIAMDSYVGSLKEAYAIDYYEGCLYDTSN